MPGTITEEKIMINGRRIYTYAVCQHKNNPIVFFIHGGPGYGTSYSLSRTFLERCPRLIEDFTFIFWDQRCAGESLCLKDFFQSSNIDDYLKDIKSLCDYYLKKYDKDKLILSGHSWGSNIGFKAGCLWPEIISGYIGIGQVINGLKGELISYQYALKKTEKKYSDSYALLKQFGPPPHAEGKVASYLINHRKILSLVGGFKKSNPIPPYPRTNTFFGKLIFSIKTNISMHLSVKRLWSECLATNFTSTDKHISFPILLICGRYDFITPTSLVISFYRKIQTTKRIYIFDRSGHRPHLEEIEKFSDVLVKEKSLFKPCN